MNIDLLILTLAISLGVNIGMFLLAFLFQTDKFTDISYAVTFILVSVLYLLLGGVTLPSLFLTIVIMLWAGRLGGYLLFRVYKMGRDKRFDERRANFWRFGMFWVLQGFTVWVVLLPSILFFASDVMTLPWYSYTGIGVFALGLVIETIADKQKFAFINNSTNKGKWIESGLWKYSRHPNYFGEIAVWAGVYLYTVFALAFPVEVLVGLVSPVFIAALIIFGSGIPILERKADEKWGNDPAYQKYKKSTSVLIPWFKKRV